MFCLSIYQSGAPNSVTVPTDVAGIGSASSRADGVGIPSLDRGQRTLSRWFNTEAFLPDTRMVAGQFGNSGRNILIGPSYTQHDVALMKNFTVTERVGLQFRAESFNVLNNWPLQASTRRSDLITRADRHKITERLLLHSPAGLLASD